MIYEIFAIVICVRRMSEARVTGGVVIFEL